MIEDVYLFLKFLAWTGVGFFAFLFSMMCIGVSVFKIMGDGWKPPSWYTNGALFVSGMFGPLWSYLMVYWV